jgi:4-hydroxybenzoate polyprenyltransferase
MKVMGLLKASHFGPTVLVVGITYVLSLTQFSASDSLFIALAILLGQFFVGWSNDLIDLPRDKAALRVKKPLVAGTITEATLGISIGIALLSALIVSLMSPLGVNGTAIHFLGLLSATGYNLKLKSTLFSVVPYIVSFGALPWAIYVADGTHPPTWIVLGFILISSAFHFLNVLKDIKEDKESNIGGLPQRVGVIPSAAIALTLLITAVLICIINNS